MVLAQFGVWLGERLSLIIDNNCQGLTMMNGEQREIAKILWDSYMCLTFLMGILPRAEKCILPNGLLRPLGEP